MRRLALLAACLASLSGCTVFTEWRGDAGFVANGVSEAAAAQQASWKKGVTTMPDVVSVLGPPDDMRRFGRELLFLYRYRYIKKREVRIVAYGGQLFQWFDGKEIDSVVVVAFDTEDRLKYVGRGRYDADGTFLSVILD